jgi:multiple sugar transport system permease protein
VRDALARGDFVSRALPHPRAEHAADIRNALAVQFVEHGWRDFFDSATVNYRLVGEYLFVRGRAFANTVLLVILSILASLTVNPLAAYALSRFRLKATEQILLFLLATMAFPAAVTAIPGFLLIRDLGLLNTFAALVLPGVASGMSIFILKGFFDALPRELYEAAAIDGAGEWTVFFRITLPMTTPILAVNALNAFIHAYSSWEWAFLVCQKESHWTLAVWMYQMSQTFAHQPWCVMAGFVLISLPTAAVFLLCQKIILRGIVLPSMK